MTMEATRPANGLARYDGARDDLAQITPETMELVLQGDLSKLTARQRVEVYLARCEAAGLDPRTKPFDYIAFQGKLTLYPNAIGAAQAAAARGINLQVVSREQLGDLLVVTCRGTTQDGRVMDRIGAVSTKGLVGQDLANALMKAETKANRRCVLALCGLAALDERDPDDNPQSRRVQVNEETGEVIEASSQVAERVTAATEQASTFAGSSGAVGESAESYMRVRQAALLEEWTGQGFDADDRPAFRSYSERALGRKPAPREDPAARAADLDAVLHDLRDRKEALKAACAAYSGMGGNPEDGEEMRDDMEVVLQATVTSRRLCTSRELRVFADACNARARAEAERAAAAAREQPALPDDDPFEDE